MNEYIDIDKVNLLEIDRVELAKLLRERSQKTTYPLNLVQALCIARTIKRAHELGVIRGNALKK